MKNNILLSVKDKLEKANLKNINMVIGFDGFVDSIIKVVDKRLDQNNYTPLETIEELGNKILGAKGLSTNIELVVETSKLGGNGPIFANALIEYGVDLSYIGLIGENPIHPVFQNMASKCNTYSLSEPSLTDALEFQDGKVMLVKCNTLKDVNWENLLEKLGGIDKVVEIFNKADLVGMENWTMLPNMSEIWKNYIKEIMPKIEKKEVKPIAFFDLADPEKRTKEDILEAMKLIGQFSEKYNVVLGLNEKEGYEIAEVFGISPDSENNGSGIEKLKDITKKIYDVMNIFCLVVHPTKEAIAYSNGTMYHVVGAYCEKPILTTGAGDNFNSGFCLGLTLGMDITESLTLGTASSGFYVRNARSGNVGEMLEFLDCWYNNKI